MKFFNKITILFVVALAVTLLAGGVYVAMFFSMKDKTAATAETLRSIEDLSGKNLNLASSIAILKSQSANIDKLSSQFFNESEVVAFTDKIDALGAQSGTVVTIESLDPAVTGKSVPYLNLRLSATGKFEDILRLFALLENFPGNFEWKTVHLVRTDSPLSGDQKGSTTTKANLVSPTWNAEIFLSVLNFVK